MARRKKITPAEAFNATLRTALEHYDDPLWLGENSVLATPYCLGQLLESEPNAADAEVRGQVLQSLIRECAAELWPGIVLPTPGGLLKGATKERLKLGVKSPRYHFLLLELRYLRQFYGANIHPVSVTAIPDYINVSSSRFYVHLEQAIAELAKIVLKRIQPSLRLEHPGAPPQLVGREAILEAILSDLPNNRSVAISGIGGIGKSFLGAAILSAWSERAGLWYTFHPGLNDDLSSVLFSIGHFLNQWGRSTLWLQLVASGGKLDNVAQALGFLRQDLETIALDSALFCFDEVDSLQTSDEAPRRESHIQLLEFLESLRGLVSLLFIGQRALIDTDAHYALPPLTPPETKILLNNADIELEGPYLSRLHRFTKGNPRLLTLYIALHQSGDEISDVIQLSRAPSARPLFNRLWKRLDKKERYTLGVLAAFRSYAPRDAWHTNPQPLESLIKRKLVLVDLVGGIALLPFFRELVWLELLAEQREQFHADAATIRVQRGQYTDAAYHYWQAADLETAVQVWYEHQDQEILRGQAGAAHEVFQNISSNHLQGQSRRKLKVIQNRLYLLAGEAERVLEGMEEFSWHPDEEITADAYVQWGQASFILGQTEKAIDRQEEAIETLARLANKIGEHYHRRGMLYIGKGDTAGARRHAQLAQFYIASMFGLIEYVAANYEESLAYYHSALELALSHGDQVLIARTHYEMAMVAGRQGRLEKAEQHAKKVMLIYEKIGNRLQLEGMRAELAGMYLNVREFDKVIEPSEKALEFFEKIKHQRWISSLCNNLAEAYYETGHLEKAKSHVHRALQLEFPESKPYALYTLGLIHQREDNLTNSEGSFQEGIRTAQDNSDRFIEAYLQRALGKMYLHFHENDKSKAPLETAVQLFEQIGLDTEVRETEKYL